MEIEITGIRSLVGNPGYIKFDGLSLITGRNSSGKTTFTSVVRMIQTTFNSRLGALNLKSLIDTYNTLSYSHFGESASKSSLQPQNGKHMEIAIKHNASLSQVLRLKYEYGRSYLILKEVSFEIEGESVFETKRTNQIASPALANSINDYSFNFNELLGASLAAIIENVKYSINDLLGENDKLIYNRDSNISIDLPILNIISEYSKFKENKVEYLQNYLDFLGNSCIYKSILSERGKTSVDIISIINELASSCHGSSDTFENFIEWYIPDRFERIMGQLNDDVIYNYFLLNDFRKVHSTNEIGEDATEIIWKDDSFLFLTYKIIYQIVNSSIQKVISTIGNSYFYSNFGVRPSRYYDLSTDSVIKNFVDYFYPQGPIDSNEKYYVIDDFTDILNTLGIEGNLVVYRDEVLNLASIFLKIDKSYINISDIGSGHFYALRMAMWIKIHMQRYEDDNFINSVDWEHLWGPGSIELVITEPEFGLHPDLQSKFCSLVCQMVSIREKDKTVINIAIETHSTIFIDTLRLEIVKRNIQPDSVAVYYFDKSEGITDIRKITIDKDGMLSDKFGDGFLDLSNQILEERLKVKLN